VFLPDGFGSLASRHLAESQDRPLIPDACRPEAALSHGALDSSASGLEEGVGAASAGLRLALEFVLSPTEVRATPRRSLSTRGHSDLQAG